MPDPRSAVAPVDDRIVHLSTLLPVPPAAAFGYITTDDLLQKWLAPVAHVEPRVGGRYELFWDPDDQENDSTIGCRITALATGELIAFQWRSPRQFKSLANAADPLTHVVVAFVPEEAGSRVHLVHSGWRSDPEWEDARTWQKKAWTGALQKLERVMSGDA